MILRRWLIYKVVGIQKLEGQEFKNDPRYNRILWVLKPHIFFDDQRTYLKPSEDDIPMVQVPLEIANKAG